MMRRIVFISSVGGLIANLAREIQNGDGFLSSGGKLLFPGVENIKRVS